MLVRIINTGDVFEGKTGVVELKEENRSLVLVDFDDEGHKVRQYFDNDNIESIEGVEEKLTEDTEDGGGKLVPTGLLVPADFDIDPIIVELAKELRADPADIMHYKDFDGDALHYEGAYAGDRLYIVNESRGQLIYVVLTDDEAEDEAYESLKRSFEDMGIEMVPENWLDSYLDEEFFEEVHRESEESWVYDMSEEDVMDYATSFGIEMEEDEDNIDFDVLRESLIEHLMNEYDGAHSMWYKDNFGYRYLVEFVKDYPQAFDEDKWFDTVIRHDGVASIISTYDGDSIYFVTEDGESYYAFALDSI